MKIHIFLIFFLLISCKKETSKDYLKPNNLPFAVIDIDNKIKNAKEIKDLKHSFELPSIVDEQEGKQKMKTTNIVSFLQFKKEKTSSFNHFRAFATIKENNVVIFISYNTGLGGGGLRILRKGRTFSIRPMHWDDIGGSEKDDLYKINYQKLTLDKSNYKIGDSIFGKLEVEIVKYFPQIDEIFDGEKFHQNERFLKQNYNGYFQTIVKDKIYQ